MGCKLSTRALRVGGYPKPQKQHTHTHTHNPTPLQISDRAAHAHTRRPWGPTSNVRYIQVEPLRGNDAPMITAPTPPRFRSASAWRRFSHSGADRRKKTARGEREVHPLADLRHPLHGPTFLPADKVQVRQLVVAGPREWHTVPLRHGPKQCSVCTWNRRGPRGLMPAPCRTYTHSKRTRGTIRFAHSWHSHGAVTSTTRTTSRT
jgi:hypothetical protein